MEKWILIGFGVTVLIISIIIIICRIYETKKVDRMVETLIGKSTYTDTDIINFDSFSNLPPPVSRYFKHVLVDGQKLINIVKIDQSGVLRTSMKSDFWSSFTARQVVVPPATGFVWNAKVKMPLGTHVGVLDSYSSGVGMGRVSILSAFTVTSDADKPELNSAALLRYLAEAVWYPTALLPNSGVVWTSIDDYSAMATLTDSGITVSLEFHFNDCNEVASIYSPNRFARLNGEYKQLPWEGHFKDYQVQGGMRIPIYGEVGWYKDRTLQLVWKGKLINVEYQPSLL